MASLVKSLLVKGFGIVNDHTDTYLILNVQSCGLQLEPCLDLMAPETVCLVMLSSVWSIMSNPSSSSGKNEAIRWGLRQIYCFRPRAI